MILFPKRKSTQKSVHTLIRASLGVLGAIPQDVGLVLPPFAGLSFINSENRYHYHAVYTRKKRSSLQKVRFLLDQGVEIGYDTRRFILKIV